MRGDLWMARPRDAAVANARRQSNSAAGLAVRVVADLIGTKGDRDTRHGGDLRFGSPRRRALPSRASISAATQLGGRQLARLSEFDRNPCAGAPRLDPGDLRAHFGVPAVERRDPVSSRATLLSLAARRGDLCRGVGHVRAADGHLGTAPGHDWLRCDGRSRSVAVPPQRQVRDTRRPRHRQPYGYCPRGPGAT